MLSDSLIHYDSCLLYHIRIQNLQVMHLGIPKKEQKISRVPWGKKKKKKFTQTTNYGRTPIMLQLEKLAKRQYRIELEDLIIDDFFHIIYLPMSIVYT